VTDRAGGFGGVARWVAGLLLLGCVASSAGDDVPACEPRRHDAPGRLNVEVTAPGLGLTARCQPRLQVYIVRSTPLRSIAVMLRLRDGRGAIVDSVRADLGLADSGGGMLAARLEGPAVPGSACRQLAVELHIEHCADDQGSAIDCPDIRRKRPANFAGLRVTGHALRVCRDD